MARKILYVDVETTGLDPKKNAIIQLSGIIINSENKKREHFNFKMKPSKGKIVDQKALDIHGISEEELWEREDPYSVFKKFESLLNKHVKKEDRSDRFLIIGFNTRFDIDMIRSWFLDMKSSEQYLFNDFFYSAYIDVSSIVALTYSKDLNKFKNFKLKTICDTVGIELDGDMSFHDAFSDVYATEKLLNFVVDKMKKDFN